MSDMSASDGMYNVCISMCSTERVGIDLDGRRYFLASEAAADFGVSPDHIARLARQGKINGRRVGKKWYVEPESLRAYLKVLGEPLRPASLSSEVLERTSAESIADAMHTRGRHTMRDWSPPVDAPKLRRPISPFTPLASLTLAIILSIAAAYAVFNPTVVPTFVSRAQSQFAAASADTSIFDRAAQFLFRAVCPIFRSCDLNDLRIADAPNSNSANQNIGSTPEARQAATTVSTPSRQAISQTSPEATSGTAPQAASASPTSAAAANPPVVQRVVERIVERALPTYTIAQGGITEAILNDRLNQLDNKLSSQIFSLSAALISVPNSLPASGGVTNNIALSQHIDNLDGTHIARAIITDATISGGNVTATTFSGLLGVGSGGTGTSTAPSYGKMLVGNSAGGYDLLATSSLGISAGGIPGGSDTYVQFNNGDVFGGLSSFTFASSTGLLTVPFATTTGITISGTASTSLFFANGLTTCNSNNNLTWADGTFACETDDTSAGAANPFAWEQNYATVNAATSSIFWAKNGLNASSTSHFANASTTEFTTGTQWFTGLTNSGLGVDANGKVYAAATSTLANISGSLALTQLANQNANTVLANATGASAAPTAVGTSSLFAALDGQILGRVNGTWIGIATTTFSTGLTYANGAVTCDIANGSILGCLSGADWTTFNGKQPALGFTPPPNTRAISTTYPLQGGGDLSADRSLSLAFGTTTANTWGAHNIFSSLFSTNASTTNGTTTNLHITGLVNSGLGIDANGKVYAAATSTLANIFGSLNLGTQVTGSLALSSIAQIGANSVLVNNTSALGNVTAIGTSTLFGTGIGGTVLAWNSGVPLWVATTTLTNGTGISTTYSATNNQWTITNTGATFAFPFTTLATYGTTTAATSSSIQTAGVFFASWTVAASVFPFASSTALSAGTLCIAADCRTTWPTAGGSGDPFTHETWWGQSGVSATTSALHLTGSPVSLFASSTAIFDLASSTAASTTRLTTGAQWFTSLFNSGLGVDANGKVYAAATSTLANISGTLALTQLANQNANTVLANATGGSAAPTAISTTTLFAGSNGKVLAFLNGGWTGTATTTFSTGLTYASGAVTCDTASASALGCLSSADWTTFNNKQAAGNYITALTGDVTASGPGSASVSFALGNTHWWTARQNFGNASTSQFTATSSVWFTSLGTPAGTFLAVDPNGLVIATSTPAVGGSGTVTNIATTYPITGGPITTTGTLSLAFGTTTANTWTHQIFSSLFASSASTTNATTTNLYITSLTNSGLGVDANGKVYAAATSTLANISGTLALTQLAAQNPNTVLANPTGASAAPTAIATSSFFGTGIGGTVLSWNAGVPSWIATTTLTNGAGITTTYSAGTNQWTIANTGALFGYPFTVGTTFATSTAATTTSISTQGVFFASSTAAASVFPFASSTAITVSGTASTTNLTVAALNAAACDVKSSTAGVLSCGIDANTAFAFTASTYGTQAVNATSTGLWLTGSPLSLAASSSILTYASSTAFTTTNQWFTGLTSSGLGVDANGKVYAAATSTLSTISGTLALTQLANQNANTVLANLTGASAAPTAIGTTTLFTGSAGQVLTFANGAWVGVGTTTLTNGPGISTTYSATNNQWTVTNTGALFGYPFTTSSTFATTTAATSSSIQTAGVFFASSTAAASQFPFASSTAITISGTASTSLFFANGLSNCTSNNVLTWTGGTFGCEPDNTSDGSANPFTWEDHYASINTATTSILWAKSGLNASSTSRFATAIFELASSTAASTTRLTTGTQWFTSLTNSGLGVDANGKVYAAATSTLSTISGTLALTQLANQNPNTVLANLTGGSAAPTAVSTTTLFSGSAGQVLTFANGGWTGTATTTNSCSSGVNCTFSAGTWTITNTSPFAWTPSTYGTQAVNATSTGLWLTGSPFSLIASSTFATYASTTAFTNSGATWLTSLSGSALGLGIDANGKVYAAATSTLSTISGTLALTQLANQSANTVLANATAGSAAPTAIATSSFFGAGVPGGYVLASNGSTWAPMATATCLQITGSAGLCDGDDATGGGSDPFTHPTTTQSATTSLLLFNGGASSTKFAAYEAWFGGTATSTFTSAGFLGIGTTSPWGMLSINPNGITGASFVIGSSTATKFIVTNGGNVGIGSTSPSTLLAVAGTSTMRDVIPEGQYTNNLSSFSIGDTTRRWNSIWAGTLNIGTSTFSMKSDGASNLGFFTAANGGGTEVFTLTSNGYVGIGTTSPTATLAIQAATNVAPLNVASSSGASVLSVDTTGALTAKLKQLTADYTVDTSSESISVGDMVAYINGNAKKPSAEGTTISRGGSDSVSSVTLADNSATALDSTHFVVAYLTTGLQIKAVIGTISGTSTVAYGTPVVVIASALSADVTALDSTHFVVAYRAPDDDLFAVVSTVSGTTITPGTPAELHDATTASHISVAALDSGKFAVAYRDVDSDLFAVVSTVSGTTITPGTPTELHDAITAQYVSAAALDSTHFVAAYMGPSNYAYAVVSTVSGTTITPGTPAALNSVTNSELTSAAALDSGKFVVAYRNSSDNDLYAVVSTVSGTTITPGTAAELHDSISLGYVSAAALDSTHFAVAYNGTSDYATAVVSTVSGTTITPGTPAALNAAASSYSAVSISNAVRFVVSYGASTNLYSTAATLPVSPDILGMATNAASAGGTVTVASNGIVTGLSGLTAGETYYWSAYSGLSTSTVPNYKVGFALSATSMLLNSGDGAAADQYFGDMIFANNFRITEGWQYPNSLIWKNQLGREIMRIDETGALSLPGMLRPVSAAFFNALMATTSAEELTASSTPDSSAPWRGSFAAASDALKTALSSLGAAVIRVFTEPIYAAIAIFDKVLAKELVATNITADTITSQQDNTQKLCIGSTCITESQLAAVLAATAEAPESLSVSNLPTQPPATTTPALPLPDAATSTDSSGSTPSIASQPSQNATAGTAPQAAATSSPPLVPGVLPTDTDAPLLVPEQEPEADAPTMPSTTIPTAPDAPADLAP